MVLPDYILGEVLIVYFLVHEEDPPPMIKPKGKILSLPRGEEEVYSS